MMFLLVLELLLTQWCCYGFREHQTTVGIQGESDVTGFPCL